MNTGKEVPKILRDLGISPLATSNGTYKITRANTQVKLPFMGLTQMYPLRRIDNLVTLSGPLKDKNEKHLLLVAETSNMVSDCFGEAISRNLGCSMRGTFSFNIGDEIFDVEGVQIEIDGYYETESAIHVVEVKTEAVESVSVRQVLYARKLAEQLVQGKKPVHSWLLVFDKEEFFNFYYFEEDNGTYSFNRDKCKKYLLKEKESVTWLSMKA